MVGTQPGERSYGVVHRVLLFGELLQSIEKLREVKLNKGAGGRVRRGVEGIWAKKSSNSNGVTARNPTEKLLPGLLLTFLSFLCLT